MVYHVGKNIIQRGNFGENNMTEASRDGDIICLKT